MSEEIRLKPRMTNIPPAAPRPTTAANNEDLISPPASIAPPATATTTTTTSSSCMSQVRSLGMPLWRSRGWMKLLAVLLFINGAAAALSLWGLLICWLPVWMGITLFSAANHFKLASQMDHEGHLRAGLEKMGLFFKINGIAALVGIVIGICIFIAATMGVLGGTMMMNQGFPPQ